MMTTPADLKYSKEHIWLKVDGATGTIGITEFAQGELGEIVYVDFPNPGNLYKQNEVFGSVEALKTTSDLFMPVTGSMIEKNERLQKEPMLINSDPFGDGWIIKISISNLAELDNLLDVNGYQQLTGI